MESVLRRPGNQGPRNWIHAVHPSTASWVKGFSFVRMIFMALAMDDFGEAMWTLCLLFWGTGVSDESFLAQQRGGQGHSWQQVLVRLPGWQGFLFVCHLLVFLCYCLCKLSTQHAPWWWESRKLSPLDECSQATLQDDSLQWMESDLWSPKKKI